MTTPGFDWLKLDQYAAVPFAAQYPEDYRTYFSPRDPGVHKLIVDLLTVVKHSLVLNMFGYDDDEADAAIRAHLGDPSIYVQMSLDRSQAGGVHEKALLAKWNADQVGNSIAIGNSIGHAISHLKVLIVDGLYIVSGSTNWSLSGEQKQDNELTLHRSALVAAQYRSVLDLNHDAMLKQMAAIAAKGVTQ